MYIYIHAYYCCVMIIRSQIHHVAVRDVPPYIPASLVAFEAKHPFHDAAIVIHLGAEDAEFVLTQLARPRARCARRPIAIPTRR